MDRPWGPHRRVSCLLREDEEVEERREEGSWLESSHVFKGCPVFSESFPVDCGLMPPSSLLLSPLLSTLGGGSPVA